MSDPEYSSGYKAGYWSPMDGGNILLWQATPHKKAAWIRGYRRGRQDRLHGRRPQ
jgi:hypothetical protein